MHLLYIKLLGIIGKPGTHIQHADAEINDINRYLTRLLDKKLSLSMRVCRFWGKLSFLEFWHKVVIAEVDEDSEY